ncbi:MAG: hypothetical protein QOE63_1849 [Acidimicrobiaceae bacterium]
MAGLSRGQRDLDAIGAGFVRWYQRHRPEVSDVGLSPFRTNPSSGFSSETLLFEVSYLEGKRRTTEASVLRLPPAGGGLFPSYDLAQQAATQNLLDAAGVPTAAPAIHEADESWIGTDFLFMPQVRGRIPSDFYPFKGWLKDADADEQRACYESYVDALLALHHVEVDDAVVDLLARPTGIGVQAELAWWAGYLAWATEDEPDPQLVDAFEWARATAPQSDAALITWGDARFANAVFDDRGRVRCLLDWEQAALGPAELDIGWWFATRRPAAEALGLPIDQELPGFLDRTDTVRRLEAGLGRPLDELEWYEAFASVRMGTCIVATRQLLRRVGTIDHFIFHATPLPQWTIDRMHG